MTERRRRALVQTRSAGLLAVFMLFASCVSPRVTERLYTAPGAREGKDISVYLEPFSITSYDFTGEDEIRAIMDRKMAVAVMSESGFFVDEHRERSDVILIPELIIKRYQQRYTERNYYLLSVKITSAGELIGQFTYEYNGTYSIFDGRVQTSLIKRFVDDFAKRAVAR
jgi:hypothetical protein